MSKLGTKSFLVVIGSLLIGLLLGVLLSITVMKSVSPNHKKGRKNSSVKIRKMIFRLTEATDEQKKQIDEVLESRKPDFLEMEDRHHLERKGFLDSVRKDIEPFLDEDQIKKMNDRVKRFENRRNP